MNKVDEIIQKNNEYHIQRMKTADVEHQNAKIQQQILLKQLQEKVWHFFLYLCWSNLF